MKKLQEVIGLSVLDVSSGKKVGTVKDIYFDLNGDVKGFLVEGSGFFSRGSFLSYEELGAIGDDAVTIGTADFLQPLHLNEQFYSFNSGKTPYKELPVVTTNGNELGHIIDVYFKEELGKIIGYEISDGFLSDITEGRRTIGHPDRQIVGKDAIVIPNDEIRDVVFEKEEL